MLDGKQKNILRCGWANRSALEAAYHDEEWGRPVHDDKRLFEMLILEGKQAGLSWSTILSKRDTLRQAFSYFNPEKLAVYTASQVEELLQNSGVIKNKLKILAAITNAQAYFKLKEQHGSLDAFLWRYVKDIPIQNQWTDISEIPTRTELSDIISADLKRNGFKFIGSTTIYAFMQSIGMVNDHLVSCFLYDTIASLSKTS